MRPLLIGLIIIVAGTALGLLPMVFIKSINNDMDKLQRLRPMLRMGANNKVLGYGEEPVQSLRHGMMRKMSIFSVVLAVICAVAGLASLAPGSDSIGWGLLLCVGAAVFFVIAAYIYASSTNVWAIDGTNMVIECSMWRKISVIPHDAIVDYKLTGQKRSPNNLSVYWRRPGDSKNNKTLIYGYHFDFRNLQDRLCSMIARGEFLTTKERMEPYEVRVQMTVTRINRLNDAFSNKVVQMQPYVDMVPRVMPPRKVDQ